MKKLLELSQKEDGVWLHVNPDSGPSVLINLGNRPHPSNIQRALNAAVGQQDAELLKELEAPVAATPKLTEVPEAPAEYVTETLSDFQVKLQELINYHSEERHSDTPDFILARYIVGCLAAFNSATRRRDRWYKTPA